MGGAAGNQDDAGTQRAQVFCTICKRSMAVEVPVPEFLDCPHCGAHFPAGGEQAPKTPDPTHITKAPEPRTSEFRRKSIPDARLPSPNSREIQTLPDTGPFAAVDRREEKKNRRVLLLLAGFVVVALGSFAGGVLSREGEEESAATQSEMAQTSGPANVSTCVPQEALVSNTGNFQGAKLRKEPGFEHPQASIITRGASISVCERVETPGKKIPNVWYRLSEGKHKGLWIHGNTLRLN